MESHGVQVPESCRSGFGGRTALGTHLLHHSELFSDESLAQLLDAVPRTNVYAWATGADPERLEENRLALDAGASGRDLLKAIAKGRFWVNVTRIDQADRRFREVIDALYAQLEEQCLGFRPRYTQGSMVISSPKAVVYLHSDAPPTMMWQVRGRKRLWVYPLEGHLLSREHLEDIFAAAAHEYLPYHWSDDAAAECHDLGPGDWVVWPQNAPHRVINLEGVNVGLSTEHFTKESRQRARVYCANRFLRMHGYRAKSTRLFSPAALMKVALHRAARAVGLEGEPIKKRIIPALRVDPNAPFGCTDLAGPVEAR